MRELAEAGVDYLDFGPQDLLFDLEANPHPRLKTLDDCVAHVRKEPERVHIRMM